MRARWRSSADIGHLHPDYLFVLTRTDTSGQRNWSLPQRPVPGTPCACLTLGGEFTYRYQDIHRSTQKITELVPGRKVTWHVVDGYLGFTHDKAEWTGTDITFDIAPKGAGTEVRFTPVGLVPR